MYDLLRGVGTWLNWWRLPPLTGEVPLAPADASSVSMSQVPPLTGEAPLAPADASSVSMSQVPPPGLLACGPHVAPGGLSTLWHLTCWSPPHADVGFLAPLLVSRSFCEHLRTCLCFLRCC